MFNTLRIHIKGAVEVRSIRGCSNNNSINQFPNIEKKFDQKPTKLVNKNKLKSSFTFKYFVRSMEQSRSKKQKDKIDDLFKNLRINNLSYLLDRIKPFLNNIKSDDLECIFERMSQFMIKLKNDKTDPLNASYQKILKFIESSEVVESILNRTVDMIDELSTGCLWKSIKFFNSINLSNKEKIFGLVLGRLQFRLQNDQLNLEEILMIIKVLKQYHLNQLERTDHRIKDLIERSIKSTRSKLFNSQFSLNDVELMIESLNVFLVLNERDTCVDLEVIDHLIDNLLMSKIRFSFNQAVFLLNIIKKAKIFKYKFEGLPIDKLILDQLLFKCNSKIYKSLTQQPDRHNLSLYCLTLHGREDEDFYLDNFHDPRLISAVTLLTKYLFSFKQDPVFIFTSIINFSKLHIYDDSLLKFIYRFIFRNERFRSKLDIASLFKIYTDFRFPFIDCQLLAELLLHDQDSYQLELVFQPINALKLFCSLVLNDVIIDEKLFFRFNNVIDLIERTNSIQNFTNEDFNQLVLAKIYSSLFSGLDKRMKMKIESKLDEQIEKLSKLISKSTNYEFFKLDSRISPDVYLSNGLFVNQIAIYDRSIRNLIPLDVYMDYFDKIDQLPLNKDQQVITILRRPRLRGNISQQYESNYNYRFNKVIPHFNIEPIEFFNDELDNLFSIDKVDFVIKKILNSFK